jgi:integrase
MPRRRRAAPRSRVGRVSVYLHHGNWWLYYRDQGRQVRRKVAVSQEHAEQIAAQVNAQLAVGAPTLVTFTPTTVPALRQQFLHYHEHVLNSSLATICRYRAATQHLQNFTQGQVKPPLVHQVQPEAFTAYLRTLEIAANGHPHSARRGLRGKGIQFILETCRSLYAWAGQRGHLPPYAGNPFRVLPLDRLKIEDAKPIFVFDADSECAFWQAADAWAVPIHFTLAKTGLRPGELVHLLVEELDLDRGWLKVRNKPDLGWRVKTGQDRNVPLAEELVLVLRRVLGQRQTGLVFWRPRFGAESPPLGRLDQAALVTEYQRRLAESRAGQGLPLSRMERARIAKTVWRDAGATDAEAIRKTFLRTMQTLGRADATCPKSWRHTFATLLQDANVDPLIRQLTLGHRASGSGGGALGMTGVYTHTRPETQHQEIIRALRLWPRSLDWARRWVAPEHNSSSESSQ